MNNDRRQNPASPSVLAALENNEAVLLMYLAGELPAEDHTEVDSLLRADTRLAAELQALRALQQTVDVGLAALDAHDHHPGTVQASVRNALRVMRKAQFEVPAPAAVAERRGLRYPWWAYPATAAAVVILAMLTWWHNLPADNGIPAIDHSDQLAVIPEDNPLERSFGSTYYVANVEPLVDAQEELGAMASNTENHFGSF